MSSYEFLCVPMCSYEFLCVPPQGVKAVPLDGSRVEVSWEPPMSPGGDLIFYTLYLRAKRGGREIRDTIDANQERR